MLFFLFNPAIPDQHIISSSPAPESIVLIIVFYPKAQVSALSCKFCSKLANHFVFFVLPRIYPTSTVVSRFSRTRSFDRILTQKHRLAPALTSSTPEVSGIPKVTGFHCEFWSKLVKPCCLIFLPRIYPTILCKFWSKTAKPCGFFFLPWFISEVAKLYILCLGWQHHLVFPVASGILEVVDNRYGKFWFQLAKPILKRSLYPRLIRRPRGKKM
jgi:hypothetical protein